MKKILFAASECVPFIKTGGLADVVGSLPKNFNKKEFDVRVVLPKYACMKQEWKEKLEVFLKINDSIIYFLFFNYSSRKTSSYR